MTLSQEDFLAVVRKAPLVSIDLLIKDQHGRYLLGKRVNNPARDFYFVPGGRIHKNQAQKEAFETIAKVELGREIPFEAAALQGIYDHFYETNAAGMKDVGTHYIVLAYGVTLTDINLSDLPLNQHSEWIWATPREITERDDVHGNTKLFFQHSSVLNDMQYQIVAERRQNYDNLLWQTPIVSLTAQAFLLTIALGAETKPLARLLAAFLSFLAALASLQLMLKHRHMEWLDSQLMERHEILNSGRGFAVISGQERIQAQQPSWLAARRSHKIWLRLLGAFAVSSMAIMVVASYLVPGITSR
jgi:colanic acid biosynthesis protein WcaH